MGSDGFSTLKAHSSEMFYAHANTSFSPTTDSQSRSLKPAETFPVKTPLRSARFNKPASKKLRERVDKSGKEMRRRARTCGKDGGQRARDLSAHVRRTELELAGVLGVPIPAVEEIAALQYESGSCL